MHKNINFNLFSVSVSAESGMKAEIRFRFGFGHKNLFRSVTKYNARQRFQYQRVCFEKGEVQTPCGLDGIYELRHITRH